MILTDAPEAPETAAPKAEAPDPVFSALSDPVWRTILERLDGADFLVAKLSEPSAISLQAVSRQTQVLVKAGLVKQERTGRISRRRLDAGPIYQAAVWINQYSKYWQSQFGTLAAWLDQIERAKHELAQVEPPSGTL